MRILLLFLCLASISFPIACKSRTPQSTPSSSAGYALEILPRTAYRNQTVTVNITGFDVNTFPVQWLINGQPAQGINPVQFRLSEVRKGDVLQAKAAVQGQEVVSNKVEILNSPPAITGAAFQTDGLKPGNSLTVSVRSEDIDGDDVRHEYQWMVNDEAAGSTDRLEKPVKRGDKISVRITPLDPEGPGQPTVLSRVIQNQPPLIQDHNDFSYDGKTYLYQVKASDADGDTLAYGLESSIDGMTVDAKSGLVTWIVPADFRGEKTVTVIVTDGMSGSAAYKLRITIRDE